ncbi:hypothetical protein HFN_0223 [Helicobacter fennelliae MRY12-0050]|uniref:Uncharacterized protein n=1 Tax=Helicobacter fennelliae MRY12-0050 TaxID=1325130 RepID=T1DW36_9HELI|nr:hypothetical protein HFN_0223 [Helicobacter fennelliae MRY12-0050]
MWQFIRIYFVVISNKTMPTRIYPNKQNKRIKIKELKE